MDVARCLIAKVKFVPSPAALGSERRAPIVFHHGCAVVPGASAQEAYLVEKGTMIGGVVMQRAAQARIV